MRKILLLPVLALAAAALGLAAFARLAPLQAAEWLIAAERLRAGLALQTIDIPGFRIAYLDGGKGEPLVLLHGIGSSKDLWLRTGRELTPRYRVISLDLPGFGDSDKPDGAQYGVAEQVARVHAVAEALGLREFHLGGISMGGFIAAAYAARYPDRVNSLWLIAPAGAFSSEPSEMLERLQLGEEIPLFARTPEEVDKVAAFVMALPPRLPEPLRQLRAQYGAAHHALNVRIFDEIRSSPPLEPQVRGLAIPTRIVWGQRDRVLHYSGASILTDLMPAASAFIVPDLGHIPILERPAQIAGDYLAFRASLSRPGAPVGVHPAEALH